MNAVQTVLVVDDEKQNRMLLAELIKDDCRVILAKNGQQAIERAREQHPDLILLDVMMPVMDGFQACRLLKDNEDTRLIPVIIMTALHAVEDRIRGAESGADDDPPSVTSGVEDMGRHALNCARAEPGAST